MKTIAKIITLAIFITGITVQAEPMSKKTATKKTHADAMSGKTVVNMVNKMVGDKKTWTPSTINVKAGTEVELHLDNTLDAPHGFYIEGMMQAPLVVKANEKTVVKFKAPKEAKTIPITCHMHPAHVGSKLVIKM